LLTFTLADFARVATALRREAAAGELHRATYKTITSLIRGLYRQACLLASSHSRDALHGRLGETLAWPSDLQETVSVTRYYTADRFLQLLRVARRPQERALLAVAWETTARPNEYLSLRVGDVAQTTHGFTLKAHVSKHQGGLTHRNPYVLVFAAEFAAFWNSHALRSQGRCRQLRPKSPAQTPCPSAAGARC